MLYGLQLLRLSCGMSVKEIEDSQVNPIANLQRSCLMVLCQGKNKKGQVDRDPAAIIIDKRVNEKNVNRMLSMLARFRISLNILLPILLVVRSNESCIYTQKI